MRFWQLPTEETAGVIGMDGARWIVEGVKAGRYHLVDRWSPKDGAVREFGLLLVGLSEIDSEPIY